MFNRAFLSICSLVWVIVLLMGVFLFSQGKIGDNATAPLLLLLFMGMLGTIGAFVVAENLQYFYTRPLEEMVEFVEKISENQSRETIAFPGGNAVTNLSRSLSRLNDRLNNRIALLEEDRQQLRTILSGMVEGVVALDSEQRILFVNDRASQLLELPQRGIIGRRLWEILRQRPLLDLVQRSLNRPESCREELKWNGATERSLTVHAARLPGTPTRGAVLVLHDTTELRRLERLRQDFVANVSHELKTPLSVIKANVETLIDGAVDDAKHRGAFLNQISSQSDRLHHLILDLLSLARIESGQEMFDFQIVLIEPVIELCINRHLTRAETRNQRLKMILPPGHDNTRISPSVWADEEVVDQIVDNLLSNAVKYTPEGGSIHVSWKEDLTTLELEVSDTGIGIPASDLPRVFERFYRVDKARSREMGGTGLGLSIVKHLAHAMGGNVRAVSEVGKGTSFFVTLPKPTRDQLES